MSHDGNQIDKKDTNKIALALHTKALKAYEEKKAQHDLLKPEVFEVLGEDGIMRIETHEKPEFNMEKPKNLEEWQKFVKEYVKTTEKKKAMITRSRITNLIQTLVLLIVMLGQCKKALKGAAAAEIWAGARIVMFSPFSPFGFTIHTLLYVVSTLVAGLQRRNGKMTRKEFNHAALAGMFGIVGGIIGAGMGGGFGFGLFLKFEHGIAGNVHGWIYNDDDTVNVTATKVWQAIFVSLGVIFCGIPGARSGRFYFKRMYGWLEEVFFAILMMAAKTPSDVFLLKA